jgi:endonuclease G
MNKSCSGLIILVVVVVLLGMMIKKCSSEDERNRAAIADTEQVNEPGNNEAADTADSAVASNAEDTADAVEATPSEMRSLEYVVVPKGVPNQRLKYMAFVSYFNKKYRVPNCVVYELTGANAKRQNYKRGDYFHADNNADGCPEKNEYRGSGYDRGHMAPANDFKWDGEAMYQCFAMTNMCPQIHDLNGGAWQKLEAKVHGWAIRDGREIIITGPILTANMPTTGLYDDIAVPRSFFKVVYEPELGRAIAFIYANEETHNSMRKHAVTVDEVERLTGMDFFSALNDKVEKKIESNSDFDAWNKGRSRR